MKAGILIALVLLTVLAPPAFTQTVREQPADVQEENPARTLQPFVLGGAAIGQPASFRLQTGIVKKWGVYVAGMTNFRFKKPDGDYGENPEDFLWTGKHFYTRWILQAGPIVRTSPNLLLYYGAGFGRCFILKETVSGQKLYSHHDHLLDYTFEVDFGCIYLFNRFVISTGFSCGTAGNKHYLTGNLGLGIMFEKRK